MKYYIIMKSFFNNKANVMFIINTPTGSIYKGIYDYVLVEKEKAFSFLNYEDAEIFMEKLEEDLSLSGDEEYIELYSIVSDDDLKSMELMSEIIN